MDPVTASMIMQGLGLMKGGAGSSSPSVTSGGNGTFSNQTLLFGDGLPAWNMNVGGSGMPPTAQAFSGPAMFDTSPRADSLVMGLTGLSTVSQQAAGNGMSVAQTPTRSSYVTLALVAAVAFGAAYILKK